VMPTDVDAICAGVLTCGRGDPENVRVVRIANLSQTGRRASHWHSHAGLCVHVR